MLDALLPAQLVVDHATGCVYLRAAGQDRWAQWPPGYRLLTTAPRARVVAADGNEYLEGDVFYFAGGYDEAPEDECSTDAEWWTIASVSREEPAPAP